MTFPTSPLLLARIWNTRYRQDGLAYQNRGHCHFSRNFRSSYGYPIHYQSEDSRADQSGHTGPPIMLTIEFRMVIIFWACNQISFEYMPFRCPWLDRSHIYLRQIELVTLNTIYISAVMLQPYHKVWSHHLQNMVSSQRAASLHTGF